MKICKKHNALITFKKFENIKLLFFNIILWLAISCSMDNGFHVLKYDNVQISQVNIPDTVNMSENVEIKATAFENTGCWSNLHFEFTKLNDFEYELKAFGTYESYGACPDNMVYKDTLIGFLPDQKGLYYFHITTKTNKIETDSMLVQ